jgi:hypothetical protein
VRTSRGTSRAGSCADGIKKPSAGILEIGPGVCYTASRQNDIVNSKHDETPRRCDLLGVSIPFGSRPVDQSVRLLSRSSVQPFTDIVGYYTRHDRD